MNAIGGQEILLPALLPREPYEKSNRWTEYGPSLFRVKDRKGADYLLGPTHEELFVAARALELADGGLRRLAQSMFGIDTDGLGIELREVDFRTDGAPEGDNIDTGWD